MSTISDVNDDAMWDTFNRFHYLCDTHRFQKLLARADLVRRVADPSLPTSLRHRPRLELL